MAAMSTSLKEHSDSENSRTWTVTTAHSALQPSLVLQKRKTPSGNQVILEDSVMHLQATTDSDDAVLPEKVSFQVIVRRPITGDSTDVTAALAVFRDIIAGDEFTSVVNNQDYLT